MVRKLLFALLLPSIALAQVPMPGVSAPSPLKYDSSTQLSFRSSTVNTIQGNTGGFNIVCGTASGDDCTFKSTSHSTAGTIFLDSPVNVWTSLPDNPGTANVITIDAAYSDGAGVAFRGLEVGPTFTQTAGAGAGSVNMAVRGAGTYGYVQDPPFGNSFQLFVAQPTLTLSTAASALAWTMLDQVTMQNTSTEDADSTNSLVGYDFNARLLARGASGTIGVTDFTGVKIRPRIETDNATATATVDPLHGIWIQEPSVSGAGTETVNNNYGIRLDALTVGTNVYGIASAITAASNRWFIYDSGGADSSIKGELRLGDNTAPTAQLDILDKLKVNTSGIVSEYNDVATAGRGVSSVVAQVAALDQTAAIGTSTLYAVPASGAGVYKITWHAIRDRAATTSSTLGALTITYTDSDGVSRAITAAGQISAGTIATTNATNSATTTGALWGVPITIYANGSTNIQYAMAYASSGATTMRYDLRITVEAL